MSKSYAKVTAELFARQHPMGDDTDIKSRFTATQRAAFKPSNFRRWSKFICDREFLIVKLFIKNITVIL